LHARRAARSKSGALAVTFAAVILPLILILLAAAAAGVLAYGTDPGWAQFNHGIDFIIWSRRLQWPLIVTALLLCVALLGLVIAGKRRAWWLIALLPILALFLHRFVTGPARTVEVMEDPQFVDAEQATFLQDGDYVIGVRFADSAYAFPYSVIYGAPAIVVSDRERRMLLMWSAFANRAVAYNVGREVRGRDLEIVSTPANALLLYNLRLGQFINGITGMTTRGERPAGFREPLQTVKLPWSTWRTQSPETRVMSPLDLRWRTAPRQPIAPQFPMPRSRPELADERPICMVASTQPIAVPTEAVKQTPLNLSAGKTPVLLFRDPETSALRAFDRHVDEDLSPRFAPAVDPKHPEVALVDADTNTEWSTAGAAVALPKDAKAKRLTPIPVEDELYWGVMKFWYPDLMLVGPDALQAAAGPPEQAASPPTANAKGKATQPSQRRRRSRTAAPPARNGT
jgi:uncharacterized integral membrane protein